LTDVTIGSATTCAFCRFPIDAEPTRCPSCSAGHHSECWAENAGCSSIGCQDAPATLWASRATGQPMAAEPAHAVAYAASPPRTPGEPIAASSALPPIGPPTAAASPPAGVPALPALGGASRNRTKARLPLIVAVTVLVVCAVGSAIAFAVSSGPTAQDRQRAAFKDDAATALREFDSLDSELGGGVKPIEYDVLMNRVEKAYDDLVAATPQELSDDPALSSMASALDEYRSAQSAWDDYINCTDYYCTPVDDELDGHWGSASSDLADAHRSLEDER